MDKVFNQCINKSSLVNLQIYPSRITTFSLVKMLYRKPLWLTSLVRKSKQEKILERERERENMILD